MITLRKQRKFWEKVDFNNPTPEGCWIWLGGKRRPKENYGVFFSHGKKKVASRIAYELSYGIDPGELLVCHHCDNPPCCNPEHLFLGTVSDNAIDMVQKGRINRKGENSHYHKLTQSQVDEIRSFLSLKMMSYAELAERYQVSVSNIWHIANNKTWV